MKIITERLKSPSSTLTTYLHDKSQELSTAAVRPAVLIFPGGGYYNCSDREGEPVALAYAAEGYNAFVARYAVGPNAPFTDSFGDAQAAIELMHTKAEEWNIDKDKIAVVGFSAGGHLASALGTLGGIRPNAMVLGYPVTLANMGPPVGKQIPGTNEKVDGKTPPAFIFSTRDDRVVPIRNTLAFADAMDKAGTPFELHIFASGDHGVSLAKPYTANGLRGMVNPVVEQWFGMSVTWLKALWGDFPAEYEMPVYDMDTESLSVNTPLQILFKHEGCLEIIKNMLPDIYEKVKDNELFKQASLKIMAANAPDSLPEDLLNKVDALLKAQQ